MATATLPQQPLSLPPIQGTTMLGTGTVSRSAALPSASTSGAKPSSPSYVSAHSGFSLSTGKVPLSGLLSSGIKVVNQLTALESLIPGRHSDFIRQILLDETEHQNRVSVILCATAAAAGRAAPSGLPDATAAKSKFSASVFSLGSPAQEPEATRRPDSAAAAQHISSLSSGSESRTPKGPPTTAWTTRATTTAADFSLLRREQGQQPPVNERPHALG